VYENNMKELELLKDHLDVDDQEDINRMEAVKIA
jgi:hypothetical protein